MQENIMTKIQIEISDELNSKLELIKEQTEMSKAASIRRISTYLSSLSSDELYTMISSTFGFNTTETTTKAPSSKYLDITTKAPCTPGPKDLLVDQYANEIDDTYTGQIYVIKQ